MRRNECRLYGTRRGDSRAKGRSRLRESAEKVAEGTSFANAVLGALPAGGRDSKRRRVLMQLTEIHLMGALA